MLPHVRPDHRPWLEAWAAASYGPGGFWQRESPGAHFRTAAASSTALAEMISQLLAQHSEIRAVVDLGAGDGDLLDALADLRPDLGLVGIDIRVRPAGRAGSVEWRRDVWDVDSSGWQFRELDRVLSTIGQPVLIMGVEWLDDLPCAVVGGGPDDWREMEVSPLGDERPGDHVECDDVRWLHEWWPVGRSAEVGSTRDTAWASVIASLRPYGGLALLIDYGHLRSDRPAAGSLAAYQSGRWVPAVPGTDRNLTAAVAVDAVRAAGERAGAGTILLARQADVVSRNERARSFPAQYAGSNRRRASASGAVPTHDRGTRAPLADLVVRSQRAALRSPYVWGGQWWLLQQVPAAPVAA